ncbi:MAG: UDP-N-acetylmuramoyl-L-alanyl-D-glutamate--2,6-diaminopimelate ligase [Planctomycetota bacterium]|nr:UDP-N-acetylmuramoyl-L-alanyl-D-glutamate--2,6-diaminopimelate ligase [Planctomycetota bacterium]
MPGDDSLEALLEAATRTTTDLKVVVGVADGRRVRRVVDDSRRVEPGDVFVARAGSTSDGARHLDEAIARGATTILATPAVLASSGLAERPEPPIGIASEDPLTAGVTLATALAGHPADRLRIVGITGTNGKTTVATLVRELVAATVGRCGLIGTVELHDGATSVPARLTTPGRLELVEVLSGMVRAGCEQLAIEISSHALDQGRTEDLQPTVAIFTNLTGDHLDYHGTMEAYATAKASLFAGLSPGALAVVNLDDPAAARMLADCRARTVGINLGGRFDDASSLVDRTIEVEILEVEPDRTTLRWHGVGPAPLIGTLPLVGGHNAFNATAALVAAIELGARPEAAIDALTRAHPPRGRLEPVHESGDDLRVYVDYAHTDDAIRNVLAAVRPSVPPDHALIALIGAGGDRDRTKRPRMMRAALDGADSIVVTSDNPRTEDPGTIVAEVVAGATSEEHGRVRAEVDRAEAIRSTILAARGGDVVVIAGKGHENYQIVGEERRHFDDREQARAALAARRAGREDGR